MERNSAASWARSTGSSSLFIIAFCILAVACRSGTDQQTQTVRLAGVPAAFYLPLMVAHDRNMFQEHGMKSELVLFNNNNDMMNALLHGDADVSGLGSGGAFALEAQSPRRVRFVYGQNNKSYSFVVPAKSPIVTLEGLKGKKIGTWLSPTPQVFLHLILDPRIGATGFEIVPIEFRFMNQTLQRGDIDALFNTDVFTQQAIESGQVRYLSKFPLEEFVMKPLFNGGGLVVRDLSERRPEVYRAVMSVLPKALAFIRDQEQESRKSLTKHIGVTDSVAANAIIDEFIRIDDVDVMGAQRLGDILVERGVVSKKIDVSVMFK